MKPHVSFLNNTDLRPQTFKLYTREKVSKPKYLPSLYNFASAYISALYSVKKSETRHPKLSKQQLSIAVLVSIKFTTPPIYRNSN